MYIENRKLCLCWTNHWLATNLTPNQATKFLHVQIKMLVGNIVNAFNKKIFARKDKKTSWEKRTCWLSAFSPHSNALDGLSQGC